MRTDTTYAAAQDHIAAAERELRLGNKFEAERLFVWAAGAQHRILRELPRRKLVTRSVLGQSAAALYFRGGLLREAERLAAATLAMPGVEAGAAQHCRELLEMIWAQRGSPDCPFVRPAPEGDTP